MIIREPQGSPVHHRTHTTHVSVHLSVASWGSSPSRATFLSINERVNLLKGIMWQLRFQSHIHTNIHTNTHEALLGSTLAKDTLWSSLQETNPMIAGQSNSWSSSGQDTPCASVSEWCWRGCRASSWNVKLSLLSKVSSITVKNVENVAQFGVMPFSSTFSVHSYQSGRWNRMWTHCCCVIFLFLEPEWKTTLLWVEVMLVVSAAKMFLFVVFI